MSETICLSLSAAETLATAALIASKTDKHNASTVAKALIAAEADGQKGHGLSRIPSYAAQARSGKVDGYAKPTVAKISRVAIRVDAGLGFAYPAIDLATTKLEALAKQNTIAIASIFHSHHFGQAGAHAEKLAHKGLLCLVFGNSPQAIAFWGGKKPKLGTNPIAFAAPLQNQPPLVIDLAMSITARGKILAAQKNNDVIPVGWALDAQGAATTDPAAALGGSMVAIGGAKGVALALMVEILSAALTGSNFGFEASSLFDDKGDPPNLGQSIVAIDPDSLSGGCFNERMTLLVETMCREDGVRLPGTRRLQNRQQADKAGLVLTSQLHDEIQNIIAAAA